MTKVTSGRHRLVLSSPLAALVALVAILPASALAQNTQGGDPPPTNPPQNTGQNNFNFNFHKAKKLLKSGRIIAVDGHGTLMLTLPKDVLAKVGDYYEVKRLDPSYDVKDKTGKVLKKGYTTLGYAQVRHVGRGKKEKVEFAVVRKLDNAPDPAIDDTLVRFEGTPPGLDANPPSNPPPSQGNGGGGTPPPVIP